MSKPAVSLYMMWRPHETVFTTEIVIAECADAAAHGTHFPYVLTDREDPRPIGMLEARPPGHRVEIGYVLAPEFWGRGYMPEVIVALADIALGLPDVFRVQAFCDLDNRASLRALESGLPAGGPARAVLRPSQP